eukprot:gene3265-724_t
MQKECKSASIYDTPRRERERDEEARRRPPDLVTRGQPLHPLWPWQQRERERAGTTLQPPRLHNAGRSAPPATAPLLLDVGPVAPYGNQSGSAAGMVLASRRGRAARRALRGTPQLAILARQLPSSFTSQGSGCALPQLWRSASAMEHVVCDSWHDTWLDLRSDERHLLNTVAQKRDAVRR